MTWFFWGWVALVAWAAWRIVRQQERKRRTLEQLRRELLLAEFRQRQFDRYPERN